MEIPGRPARMGDCARGWLFSLDGSRALWQCWGMAFPSTTWDKLWADCFAVARRPLGGVILPLPEAEAVARGAFQSLISGGGREMPIPEIMEFLRRQARRGALEAVAAARRSSGDPARWAEFPESAPTVSLESLRQDDAATDAWKSTLGQFRQRTYHTIKTLGVPPEEIDDVLSDTLLQLFRPRAEGGPRPLDNILVYEELMPYLNGMARHVATDYLRARTAQKRQPKEGFSEEEEMEQVPSDDPVPGETYSLEQCYRECRDVLSDFQWDVLMRLYVLESANRMSLIEEPAVLKALGVKPSASSATRRRRLNEYLEEMVGTLAARLRVPA